MTSEGKVRPKPDHDIRNQTPHMAKFDRDQRHGDHTSGLLFRFRQSSTHFDKTRNPPEGNILDVFIDKYRKRNKTEK